MLTPNQLSQRESGLPIQLWVKIYCQTAQSKQKNPLLDAGSFQASPLSSEELVWESHLERPKLPAFLCVLFMVVLILTLIEFPEEPILVRTVNIFL